MNIIERKVYRRILGPLYGSEKEIHEVISIKIEDIN
jgi:hypothetical protein